MPLPPLKGWWTPSCTVSSGRFVYHDDVIVFSLTFDTQIYGPMAIFEVFGVLSPNLIPPIVGLVTPISPSLAYFADYAGVQPGPD